MAGLVVSRCSALQGQGTHAILSFRKTPSASVTTFEAAVAEPARQGEAATHGTRGSENITLALATGTEAGTQRRWHPERSTPKAATPSSSPCQWPPGSPWP